MASTFGDKLIWKPLKGGGFRITGVPHHLKGATKIHATKRLRKLQKHFGRNGRVTVGTKSLRKWTGHDGSNKLHAAIQTRAQKLADKLFTGTVPDEETTEVYPSTDVAITPDGIPEAFWEPFDLVVTPGKKLIRLEFGHSWTINIGWHPSVVGNVILPNGRFIEIGRNEPDWSQPWPDAWTFSTWIPISGDDLKDVDKTRIRYRHHLDPFDGSFVYAQTAPAGIGLRIVTGTLPTVTVTEDGKITGGPDGNTEWDKAKAKWSKRLKNNHTAKERLKKTWGEANPHKAAAAVRSQYQEAQKSAFAEAERITKMLNEQFPRRPVASEVDGINGVDYGNNA